MGTELVRVGEGQKRVLLDGMALIFPVVHGIIRDMTTTRQILNRMALTAFASADLAREIGAIKLMPVEHLLLAESGELGPDQE